ncbi:MAG: hypothetical protein QM820_44325 [Minicystis sp.]
MKKSSGPARFMARSKASAELGVAGGVRAQHQAEDVEVGVAEREAQHPPALVGDVLAHRMIVDRHREAAVHGEPRIIERPLEALVEVVPIAGEQEEPPARERGQPRRAAERRAGEREARLRAGARVPREDLVEIRLGVIVARRRPGIEAERDVAEGIRAVEIRRARVEGQEALVEHTIRGHEGILRDAIEDVVGDHHQRVLHGAGGEGDPGVDQLQPIVALDVEEREVEDPLRHEGRERRMRLPERQVRRGEVRHHVDDRDVTHRGAAPQIEEGLQKQEAESPAPGPQLDEIHGPVGRKGLSRRPAIA